MFFLLATPPCTHVSMSLRDDAPAPRISFRRGIPGPASAAYMAALRTRERADFRKEPGVDPKLVAVVPRNSAGIPLDEAAEGQPPYLRATVGDEGAVGYAGINSTRRLHAFAPGQVLCVRGPKVGVKTPPRLYGVCLINSVSPTLANFWVDVRSLKHFEIAGDVAPALEAV